MIGRVYVYRYRGRRFSRVDRYRRAEDEARAHGRATWARRVPSGPAELGSARLEIGG